MASRNLIFILLTCAVLSGCVSSPSEDETAAELYAIAKKNLDNRNWLTAIDLFRKLEAKYPYGVYAEQAQLDTIYAHYRNEDVAQIIAGANRFIKLYPTHRSVDYAYYLKGLANYQEDNSLFGRLTGRNDLSDRDASISDDAFKAFTDVYTQFPDSQYATDSRIRAHHLYTRLAWHELVVAGYYFSRHAYVAVVNRAKRVIEDYSDTAVIEEALALLMFSYREMGLPDLAESTERVLAHNFSQSGYLDEDGKENLENKLNIVDTVHEDKKTTLIERVFENFPQAN